MMLTFKQLEPLFWIVELGPFEAAASKLNASQSAIFEKKGAGPKNSWMCAPTLVPQRMPIPLAEISQFPLLTQANASGTGMVYGRFLQDQSVHIRKVLSSSNLIAQLGLTVPGLGISYLPSASMQQLVAKEILGVVQTNPPLIDHCFGQRKLHALDGFLTRCGVDDELAQHRVVECSIWPNW